MKSFFLLAITTASLLSYPAYAITDESFANRISTQKDKPITDDALIASVVGEYELVRQEKGKECNTDFGDAKIGDRFRVSFFTDIKGTDLNPRHQHLVLEVNTNAKWFPAFDRPVFSSVNRGQETSKIDWRTSISHNTSLAQVWKNITLTHSTRISVLLDGFSNAVQELTLFDDRIMIYRYSISSRSRSETRQEIYDHCVFRKIRP